MGEIKKMPVNDQQQIARLTAENTQLKNILQQSNQRLKQAAERIQFLETNDFYRHLEWVWNIIHDTTIEWDKDFKDTLTKEFIEMMTLQKAEEAPTEAPTETKEGE